MERSYLNKLAFILALGLVAFTTIAYGGVHQAVLAIVYVFIALLAVIRSVDLIRSGEIKISTDPIQLVLLAAAAYGFLQVIPFGSLAPEAGVRDIPRTISVEPFATLLSATNFFALFIFFAILSALIDSAERVRKIVLFVSAFGFIYAFYAVLQSVLSPDKIFGIYGRVGASVFGSFVNRNHFAAWMEMAVAIPLGLLISGAVTKDKRLLYGTAIALMGASILLSGSRGGLIAFITQIIFLTLVTYTFERRKFGLRIALAVGLIAVVIGGAVFVGGETSLTRISEEQGGAGPSEGRDHIWAVGLKVIGQGLPFGVGLGAFGTAYSMNDTSSGLQRVEQAHNDYLQVLTDAGIPGALIGLGFLFLIYRSGRRALLEKNDYRRAVGAGSIAGIIGVLVHSVFDFVLHTTAIAMLFLLLLALLTASQYLSDEDAETGEATRRRRNPDISPRQRLPYARAAAGETPSGR